MGTYDTAIQIDDLVSKGDILACFDTSGADALVTNKVVM